MNKYSFKELLSEKVFIEKSKEETEAFYFTNIEIPMIQRDYAHGREDQEEIRERFLNSVFESLLNGYSLNLDFVYGSIHQYADTPNEVTFQPLDGQQRLTTLFLLYYYIGSQELDEETYNNLKKILQRFTYATRTSSRAFCEKLISFKLKNDVQPTKQIKNEHWFFNSYQKDPTIKSMLTMLDAIHNKYCDHTSNVPPIYNHLERIKFFVLPLDGFNLSEELYVKMNARGIQLTDFENFKADLTNWMKNLKNFQNEKELRDDTFFDKNNRLCINDKNGQTTPYYLYFSSKLDNEWTDFFWKKINLSDSEATENKKSIDLVDPLFMRFFNRYFCNLRVIHSDKSSDEIEKKDNIFRFFYGDDGDDSNLKYKSFSNHHVLLSPKVIFNIEKVIDTIQANYEIISEYLSAPWETKKWHFYDPLVTQRQRISFFATTSFIEVNNEFDPNAYADWMRFVWNIIIDPNIRSISAMINALRYINELKQQSKDILRYLSDCSENTQQFPIQFEEERFKAKLILDEKIGNKWKDEIVKAEKHKLFQGNIRFLLTEEEKTSFDDYIQLKDAAFKLFEKNDLSDANPDNFLWIRALLAKTDLSESPGKINFANGRFYNWRFLLNRPLFIKSVQKLMDEIKESNNEPIDQILRRICKNYRFDPKNNWIFPLVNWEGLNGETLLGNYSESKKVQQYNDYGRDPMNIYLYNKTIWTESNILLSSFRNAIASSIISTSNQEVAFCWDEGNIHNQFFRGWDLWFERKFHGFIFQYFFDREFLRIGIHEEDENPHIETQFKDNEIAPGWICRKKFNYKKEVTSFDAIPGFIEKIENEVFDLENPGSLAAKILI